MYTTTECFGHKTGVAQNLQFNGLALKNKGCPKKMPHKNKIFLNTLQVSSKDPKKMRKDPKLQFAIVIEGFRVLKES